MIYSIAGFKVQYEPVFERLKARSEKYIYQDQSVTPDFQISVTDDEIKEHLKNYQATEELAEYVLMGAKFYKEILSKDAFFLHSSSVCVDSEGFAFTGPCGAGKSTHSALWRKYFGEKAIPVNDDKPVIRIIDGKVYVCGTPFSGKHDINTNIIVPLKGICVLNQAKENSVKRLSSFEAIGILMEQTLRCNEADKMASLLSLLDTTLQLVPVYRLSCNISFEAVELSYKTLSGK